MKIVGSAIVFLALLLPAPAPAQERQALFREEFQDLERWKPFTFPKIKKHSSYTIEREGDASYLRAESNASASAIVYGDSFSVAEYPKVRWRWKIGNVYAKTDPTTKAGDDYPLRIYVMFDYEPAKAGFVERIEYGIAKGLYGAYPPHSTLNYAWSSVPAKERVFPNPFTARARMIVLRQGPGSVGAWQEEDVDIVADYRAAFGSEPPARARIAIMNDSDNTGDRSVSWVDYIEVLK